MKIIILLVISAPLGVLIVHRLSIRRVAKNVIPALMDILKRYDKKLLKKRVMDALLE